jgi:hypothetical protein
MTHEEMVTLTEVLSPIATLTTILFAFYGLDAWRREHTGRRRIELAEDAVRVNWPLRTKAPLSKS